MIEAVKIRTALACDDIRIEENGKLIVIGLINPILELNDEQASSRRSALRLNFLLSIDVKKKGNHELAFRLHGLKTPHGQSVKLEVDFSEAAKNIPFPIGPLILPLMEDERGFELQQHLGDRWRTIATWRFSESYKAK
ncbi:hypothetical protein AA0312_2910 [Acetobacter tropicalis NRIC 0312]|uniref:Uncharacterized protein n=1 Tax=Acetobacter tropicalis TaxID=104102 RepID=A0A511FSL6_9PROT|nr:hypothetical protein [Acetobacter tropicalis]KXV52596.1 hypothetical protein AD944_00725 [Acetobacter tropicalis]GAL95938.1 hypothetical protein ATR1_001c0003 [Acetobacter tropicalis]GBR72418.1 hypothetical protein AA0312_2910 [Acetobacter tropicalis NRIC 0312]GEL51914.1 hypothetical protein ATR01nite_29890 [Acetobacter tropicalis]